MAEIKRLFNDVNIGFRAVDRSGTGDGYEQLTKTLELLDAGLHGHSQKLSHEEMQLILEKLRHDESLSKEDLKNLKQWIVGEAEAYINAENSFDHWIVQLPKVIGMINDTWSENPDVATSIKLRGLIRDAIRIIADITYLVQEKERVEKFEETMKEIGSTERLVLMRVLEQKIKSTDF